VRLHLVDGTYELYRAHFSPRPDHRDPSGRDAKATVGIVESMLALLHDADEAVTHIAVVFDNPIRSFRNDLYLPYKSDDGVPPELRAQFDAAEDAIRSIGVAVWSMHEYEADDGLASGARRFRDEVEQVRILSPDKDLGQCIRGVRVVQVDRRQRKVTNEASFRAERGFGPDSMADFLALTGDSADGFPGLPGFGKKSAGMLVGAYGTIEKIPADSIQWKVKPRGALQLAATLAERRDEALLYRKLATLVADVAPEVSLEELKFAGVPRARFEQWCKELGVQRLMAAPRRWQ
jgi:5'-3' exonuclease